MIKDAFEMLARWGRPRTPVIRPRQSTEAPGSRSSTARCPDASESETSNNDGPARLVPEP